MKNKTFLVGALVAMAIAIGGVLYSGVGTGQQASVGNLLAIATAPKVVKPVYDNSVYVGGDRVANPQTTGTTANKMDSQPKVKYPTSGEPKTGMVEDKVASQPKVKYPTSGEPKTGLVEDKYVPTSTFPDGCTSTTRYSSTTGMPCLKPTSSSASYIPSSSTSKRATIHIVGDGTGGGHCAVYADSVFLGYVKCP